MQERFNPTNGLSDARQGTLGPMNLTMIASQFGITINIFMVGYGLPLVTPKMFDRPSSSIPDSSASLLGQQLSHVSFHSAMQTGQE